MNKEKPTLPHIDAKKEAEIYTKSRNYDDPEENREFELNQMLGEE